VNAWDHAAGGLVAREAGARVEGVGGVPVDSRLLISAVPTIFDELHDLLVSLGAHTDDSAAGQ
jgi:myo-inositol-1(or 4)-monophosphatase